MTRVEPLPAGLSGREYDLTSRHVLVARIVKALVRSGGLVLDLGGAGGLTKRLLGGYRIVTADIVGPGVEVFASGTALPFGGAVFDALVALDVLEHVPADTRSRLIDEALRTADLVVFAGPYHSPEVIAAEDQQRALFEALFDRPHPWLREHELCGLPSLDDTVAQLASAGMATGTVRSNPLGLWSAQLVNSHVALRFGFDDPVAEIRDELLAGFLDVGDGTPPSYRTILVGSRKHDDVAVVLDSVQPATSPAAVEAAVNLVEQNTAKLVNRALTSLDTLREDMAEGWAKSVDEYRRLELQHRAAVEELTAALERARAGWADSVALNERITAETSDVIAELNRARKELKRARREHETFAAGTAVRIASLEQAYSSLEDLVVAAPAAWRVAVAGPPLVARPMDPGDNSVSDYQAWIAAHRVDVPPHVDGPRFSVLVPVFNPTARHLEACIRSVRAQTYPRWELVLYNASTASHPAPICRRFAALDERVAVVDGDNLGIAANTNAAAAVATGDWFLFLDHDDELAPHALASVAAAIATESGVDFVYSDEDKIDGDGNRSDPFFKPDWSPDLLRTLNYITHLTAVDRQLWDRVGGLRAGYDGAQDYEFVLRATHAATSVVHIADVLYHWRTHPLSTAGDVSVKPDAHRAGAKALTEFAARNVPGATVEFGVSPTTHRLRYPIRPERVSIIIPFRDEAKLTQNCLDALDRYRGTLAFDVLLVDNQSIQPETAERIAAWRELPWASVSEFDEPFNFQRMNNWAVAQTDTPLVLFLNNDVEPLHPGWLEALAEHAQRPEVGAVGARLFYPNGLVQHAGVAVGVGGFADHPWAGLSPDAWTAGGPSYWVRNFLAVTAAVLLIERRKFDEVGGFDERFTIGGGDVDLGIRLTNAGYRNVMTPYARLIHHESPSRGTTVPESDLAESLRSYRPYLAGGDPFYNPNLTRADTTCRVNVGE